MKRTVPVLFSVPFAVGLLVASLAWSNVIYLPLIATAQPFILDLPPRQHVWRNPDGRLWHLTNGNADQDGAGVVYVSTRLPSDIGGVVYREEPDGTLTTVLRLGPEIAHANGEIEVWANGWGYYVTVNKDQTIKYAIPIPGWTRVRP
jgi:hypothetical protein